MTTPPWLRGARAAAIFLTRVPIGGFPFSREDWRWSSAYFPFVGILLGAAQAAVFKLSAGAGPHVAATLAVIASLLLTGAFHEDGLADTADALGGAYTRERIFEILKDSRVGSFGASALVVVLVLRILLLARLDASAPWALLATQGASRVPPIWLMVAMPYVSGDADAKSKLVTRAGFAQAALATIFGTLPVVVALHGMGLGLQHIATVTLTSASVTAICGWRFHVRAGGITGDFLGATQQVAECALLLTLVQLRP